MAHRDDPSVPRPCQTPVSAMEPREKGSLCRECDTMVLDSARHTRAEFLALLAGGQKVCAQLRTDETGRVRFSDSKVRRRLQVVVLSAALAGCGDDAVGTTVAPTPPVTETERVGRVASPTEPTTPTTPTAPSIPPRPGPMMPPETPPAPPEPTTTAEPTEVEPTAPAPPPHGTVRGRVAPPHRHEREEEIVGLVEMKR